MSVATATALRRGSTGHTFAGLARFGLAARAVVYVVIGWLAIQIAQGHGSHQANQRGALADIAQHPGGVVLLWLLALGFAAYALWRFLEAAFGTASGGEKALPRVVSLARGVVYAALSVSTFSFIAGSSQRGQAQQQQSFTATLMRQSYGRYLVGLIGAIVVIVGVVTIIEGFTRKFEKQLRLGDMSRRVRSIVVALGVVGTIARGVVFALTGALIVDAAVTFNPGKSTGLDGALRALADRPYGPLLLGIVAVGVIAFGLYGFAAARWVKT